MWFKSWFKKLKTANANKLDSIPLLINELDYLRGERLESQGLYRTFNTQPNYH